MDAVGASRRLWPAMIVSLLYDRAHLTACARNAGLQIISPRVVILIRSLNARKEEAGE